MWPRRMLSTLGLLVAAVLAAGTNGGDETGTTSTVDLAAQVRFTGTQIVIRNADPFDWTNVKLEINSGLVRGGFVLNVSRISAGQEYTVGAMQFAKGDGERFNPLTHKPQNFTISCDTPRGRGFYYGEWK